MADQLTDRADAACRQLILDLWHPNCWTLEVTDQSAGGLLGHGVYEVNGRVLGRFTAFGDTGEVVDELVAAIEDSPLTHSVRETAGRRTGLHEGGIAAGHAARGLLVAYERDNSVAASLISRGFIPDAPVRIKDGRERWTVLTDADRDAVRGLLDDVREEANADIQLVRITDSDVASTSLLPVDTLSDRQREVFEFAREQGYYDWPRAVLAADLAEELDVSKATVLEHLRKAESKLLDP